MSLTLYWAGPLFTQAERLWNQRCATALRRLSYDVLLPQEEAIQFFTPSGPDLMRIAEHCRDQATECDVMVAILDGADSDSGTSIEVGIKLGHRNARKDTSKIIGVRTDFRTSEDGQLNAMFRLLDDVLYFPSYANDNPDLLCDAIDGAIRKLRT